MLNNHPAISPATIKRIKLLAAQMGYVPSATARGLKTSRTHAFGVITSNIDDPFWSEVLKGVEMILNDPVTRSGFYCNKHLKKVCQ